MSEVKWTDKRIIDIAYDAACRHIDSLDSGNVISITDSCAIALCQVRDDMQATIDELTQRIDDLMAYYIGVVESKDAQLATLQAATPVGLSAASIETLKACCQTAYRKCLESIAYHQQREGGGSVLSSDAVRDCERLQGEMQKITHALAELELTPVADAEGVGQLVVGDVWEPVPDGFLADPNVDSWWLHTAACHITIGTKEGGYTYFLPSDYRLCQRRPHAQQDSQEVATDEQRPCSHD